MENIRKYDVLIITLLISLVLLFFYGLYQMGLSLKEDAAERKKEESSKVCDKEKLSQFIIDCARAANPLSDEEGEDLVSQCQRTGERIFCNKPLTGN